MDVTNIKKNEENATSNLNIKKMNIIVKFSNNERLMDVPNGSDDIFPPYRMRGPKRGVVLVINNIEFENNIHEKRNGADVDAENLKELFRQLGFEWIYWENQTHKDIRQKLREFTDDSNTVLSEVDSCFVIVMSHGGQGSVPEDTHIITHDNKQIKASYFTNNFSNSNCKQLQGKPKVIIFQACRGVLRELCISVHSKSNIKDQINTTESDEGLVSQTSSETTISNGESDMLICYTTSPGCLSFRDPSKGTWFIQNFCEIFMNHAYHKDVYTLFGMITAKVIKERAENNALQKPHIHTIHFRPCYLNPSLIQGNIVYRLNNDDTHHTCMSLETLPPNAYPMNGPKRGVALVINNIEFRESYFQRRDGAEIDRENLKRLFINLGFEWIYWENLSYRDFMENLHEFTDESNAVLSEVDSCFVIVLSHGQEGGGSNTGSILTSDNKRIDTSYIINRFRNSKCKSLRGKPKVIVIAASRGDSIHFRGKPTKTVETSLDENSLDEDSDISDMLVCYASKVGYASYRNRDTGTWLIQDFCEIFKNHAHNTDVEKLFDMVVTRVATTRFLGMESHQNAIQLPHIDIKNFRKCYLNPPFNFA